MAILIMCLSSFEHLTDLKLEVWSRFKVERTLLKNPFWKKERFKPRLKFLKKKNQRKLRRVSTDCRISYKRSTKFIVDLKKTQVECQSKTFTIFSKMQILFKQLTSNKTLNCYQMQILSWFTWNRQVLSNLNLTSSYLLFRWLLKSSFLIMKKVSKFYCRSTFFLSKQSNLPQKMRSI